MATEQYIKEVRDCVDKMIQERTNQDTRQAQLIIDLCNQFAVARWLELDYEDERNMDWSR